MNTFVIIFVFVGSIFHVDGVDQIGNSIPSIKFPKVENENFFEVPPHFDINMKYTWENPQSLIQANVRVTGRNQEKTKRLVLKGYLMEFDTRSILVAVQNRILQTDVVYYRFNGSMSLVEIFLKDEIEASAQLLIYMEYTMRLGDWYIWNKSHNETQILVNHKEDTRTDHRIECSYMFPCFGNGVLSTFSLTINRENGHSSVANGEVVKSEIEFQPDSSNSDKYTWLAAIRPEKVTFLIFSKDIQYVESVFGKNNKSIRVYAPKEEINIVIFQFTANVFAEVLTYFEEESGVPTISSKFDLFFVPQSYMQIEIETPDINVYGYTTNLDSNHSPTGKLELTKAKTIEKLMPGIITQYSRTIGESLVEFIHRYLEYHALGKVKSFNSTLSDLALYQDFKDIEKQNGFSAEDEHKPSNKFSLILRSLENPLHIDNAWVSIFFAHFLTAKLVEYYMEKKGMQVITVSIANSTHFAFKQEPFRNRNLDAEANDEISELWNLPVTHIQNLQKLSYTLLSESDTVSFISGNIEEYIIVNPDGTGYHRTLYDSPILLNRIQTQLNQNHESFTPLGRARLLSDYFSFAENGYSNSSTALRLTNYLNKETSLVVWTAFLDKFNDIYFRFLNHPQYHVLEYFLMRKVDFRLREMDKLSDLSEEMQLLRPKLLSVSCRFGSIRYRSPDPPYCFFYARELFRVWSTDSNGVSPLDSISPWSLHPDLKCAIVASSGKESFDFMFAKLRNFRPESYAFNDTLRSLACAHDTNVIHFLLEKTLQPPSAGGFSQREVAHLLLFMIESTASNSRPEIIHFLSKNYHQLAKKVENGDFFMRHLINSLAYQVYTLEQRNEVKELLELHQPELFNSSNSLMDSVNVLNIMDKNIDWMNRNEHDIITGILS